MVFPITSFKTTMKETSASIEKYCIQGLPSKFTHLFNQLTDNFYKFNFKVPILSLLRIWAYTSGGTRIFFCGGHRGGKRHTWGGKNNFKKCWKWLIFAIFSWGGGGRLGQSLRLGGGNAPLVPPLAYTKSGYKIGRKRKLVYNLVFLLDIYNKNCIFNFILIKYISEGEIHEFEKIPWSFQLRKPCKQW